MLADPTSPIPSHCCNYPVSKCPSTSIISTSTLRVNIFLVFTYIEYRNQILFLAPFVTVTRGILFYKSIAQHMYVSIYTYQNEFYIWYFALCFINIHSAIGLSAYIWSKAQAVFIYWYTSQWHLPSRRLNSMTMYVSKYAWVLSLTLHTFFHKYPLWCWSYCMSKE